MWENGWAKEVAHCPRSSVTSLALTQVLSKYLLRCLQCARHSAGSCPHGTYRPVGKIGNVQMEIHMMSGSRECDTVQWSKAGVRWGAWWNDQGRPWRSDIWAKREERKYWEKRVADRGNSRCKGPNVRRYLTQTRACQEASLARAQRARRGSWERGERGSWPDGRPLGFIQSGMGAIE